MGGKRHIAVGLGMFGILAALFLALLPRPIGAQAGGPTAATYVGVASCGGTTCHGRSEGDGRIRAPGRTPPVAGSGDRGGRAQPCLAGAARPPRGGDRRPARHRRRFDRADVPRLPRHPGRPARAEGSRPRTGSAAKAATAPLRGWLTTHYQVGGTHALNVARGMVPLDNPRAPRRALPRLPFRQRRRRPVRHPPDHGRGPPQDQLRARPLLDPPGALFRPRRRLCRTQGPAGFDPDLGDRPGDGARSLALALHHRARRRGDVPRILFLRLPLVPPAGFRTIRASARQQRPIPAGRSRPHAAL